VDDPKSFGILAFLLKHGLQQARIKSTALPIWKGSEIPEIAVIRWEFNINIEFADRDPACGELIIRHRLTSDPRDIGTMPVISTLDDFRIRKMINFGQFMPVVSWTGCESGQRWEWGDYIFNPIGCKWHFSLLFDDAKLAHIFIEYLLLYNQAMFQVVERQPQEGGTARPSETWETGWKDTVIAYPQEITRGRSKFDFTGRYVWHCHILEHEDNEIMRPLDVLPEK
jgi:hypothetical protein